MKDFFQVTLPASLPKDWKPWINYSMLAMGAPGNEYCPCFESKLGLYVTITCQREKDGKRWTHLSVSRPNRVPTYNELCQVKEIFLGKDALALLLFVPESEHVNIHPFCLHLWSCLDERPTPDFTWGLGSI